MVRRKKSSINQLRSVLYFVAKLLGDINAVQKGTVGKRIVRRQAGKQTSKLLGRFLK